jgi:hypothetical protein
LQAEVKRNGKAETWQETVKVRAGREVRVAMTEPAGRAVASR